MRGKVILLSCFVFMLVPGSLSKAGEPILLVEYVFDSNFSDTSGNGLDGIPGGTANAGSVSGGVLTLDGGGWVDIPFGAANPFDGSKDYIIEVRFKTSTSHVILLTSCPLGEPEPPGQPPWPLMVFTEDGGEIRVDFWYKSSTQSSVGGFVDGTMHTAEIIFESPSTWTFTKDGSPAGGGGLDGATDVSNDVVRIGSSASSEHLGDESLGVNFNGQIDYIRIWGEEETEAMLPEPGHNATNVCPNDVELSWVPGKYADTHDVYLGSTVDDVNISTADPCATGLDSNSWMLPYRLKVGTTYYWRVVEVNLAGPDPCYWPGDQWQFRTNEGAFDPHPADEQTTVPLNPTLHWTRGCLAVSHDVYFGTDYSDVNDANTTVTLGVYRGNQSIEANSYDPCGLELGTTYYWRVDEVNDPCTWKGDVWSFTVAVVDLEHVIVYYEADRFAGWPANNGLLWNWGDDEVMVGFTNSDFLCQGGHNNIGTEYSVLARSMDGGETWTVEDPDNFVGDGGTPSPSPGNINFADPNFTMRVVGMAYHGSTFPEGAFYFSYDRGSTWQGPYEMGNFSESTVDSWEKTPRTDYIVNGPNDCMVFMSARPDGGAFGTDRAFCVRTTDGGTKFQFQGWIVPPSDPYRGVMPSTVRCSPTKLVSALRRRNMGASCDAWVDTYVSNDNGVTWSFLSRVGETGCENGNPPALVRLSDTRLCCVYGNRTDMRMYMKYSEDEGATWGEQITLRDDWADCADDRQDLGYPRITQLPNGRIISAYYWSTPDHIENHIAATIWEPGDVSVARYPHPTDGASDVPPDVVLSWRPGLFAAGAGAHDVYVGTDFNDVNGAGKSSDEYKCSLALEANSYDPCGIALATTYYWRVDENNDPNLWKGSVWSFRTANYVIVDDMEDYTELAGENPISLGPCGWECGYTNNTGSFIDLWTGLPTREEQAMRYFYANNENNGLGYYAEIKSQCLDPCDWTTLNVKSLTLWFYGDPNNDADTTEQMYVAVEDDNSTYVEVRYGDHGEDMNDIRIAEWQEWNIDLNDFNDGGVILSDVNYMYIGFGQRYSLQVGGSGIVYFDDIRLYLARCVPEFSSVADFTDDCLVNFGDFAIVADQWLKPPGSPSADIAQPPDGIVDMWDLALLVDDWLEEKLWPLE